MPKAQTQEIALSSGLWGPRLEEGKGESSWAGPRQGPVSSLGGGTVPVPTASNSHLEEYSWQGEQLKKNQNSLNSPLCLGQRENTSLQLSCLKSQWNDPLWIFSCSFTMNINIFSTYHMLPTHFHRPHRHCPAGLLAKGKRPSSQPGRQREEGAVLFKGQCHFPLHQDSLSIAGEIIDLKLLQSQPIEKWNRDVSSC